MKKLFALILAVIMVLAFGAGCAETLGGNDGDLRNTDNNGGGEVSGVIGNTEGLTELTIYSQTANFAGVQGGWAGLVLEERFGVRVTIVNEMDGTFATRMASGDLGDIIIFGSDGNQYQQAASEGMLFDWERGNLVQTYGPYIYANMPYALQKNRDISGGTLYGFGFDVASDANDHVAHIYYPYLRWDLYLELGMPPINTLEDFIPILAAMKELEPFTPDGRATYGVSSFPDWDEDMVMMVKATAALYGWEEFGFGLYNVLTQEFQGALEPGGEYLRCLKFYNTLFQMGLYDPDSMTQRFDDAAMKYRNGVSFWNIFTFVAEDFNTPDNLEAGRALMCIPAADQRNLVEGLNVYGGNRVWTIGAKTDYPELCMEIINWLSTPEGVLTYHYGPQGVTWDYDEFGNTYLTPLGLQIHDEDNRTPITYGGIEQPFRESRFQHNNNTFSRDSVNPESASGETFNWEFWDSTILNKPVTAIEQSWRDWSGTITADEFLRNEGKVAVSIGTPFAIARRDSTFDMTWEQVKGSIVAGSWRAIYAASDAEFDRIIADMIAEAHAYGYEECMTWIKEQAQIRREHEDRVRAGQ
jgi:multiple sugar transport system substrate-binding protein/putative aldouronate transport system substrate-binding protein